jgi:hypothetical protein
MCWSGEASAVLATAGFISTGYVAVKGEDKNLWIPLGYFSLMELLQAFTYTVIDQCALPLNQILTLLGAMHIAFQPFFINMFSMHFIPAERRARISSWVYAICFVGTVAFLMRQYPFAWAGLCHLKSDSMCGEHLCSVHGNWHIAWEVPMNGLTWLGWGYYFPALILPVIYGSWRFTLYHALVGPGLALLTTDNWNEWPAVWCLFSIGLLLVVIKTPIRKLLYQNWWFF